jgi:hypothetical protein
MIIMAMLLRPWVLQMREMGLRPRVYADDVTVMAVGDKSLDTGKLALNVESLPRHTLSKSATASHEHGTP